MTEKQAIEVKEKNNVVTFSKPFQFEGKEYKELVIDTDSLTGNDIELAESQFVLKNPQIAAQTALKELSKGFQAILAARAAGVPVELIKALPARDYSKVTMQIQTFLLNGE